MKGGHGKGKSHLLEDALASRQCFADVARGLEFVAISKIRGKLYIVATRNPAEPMLHCGERDIQSLKGLDSCGPRFRVAGKLIQTRALDSGDWNQRLPSLEPRP